MEISTRKVSNMRLSFKTQFKIEIFTTVYWSTVYHYMGCLNML